MLRYDHETHPRSLYIHWPFCPYKCHFCPFVALANHDQYMESYHKALSKEISTFGKLYVSKLPLDTIYIGGGTPSTYPDALLLDMFAILKELFEISATTEITLEVNPGTVRIEQLDVWKQCGINRLSIGVQSLKDSALKDLNRHQTIDDVHFVVNNAYKVFDNMSVDFILGLPGVSDDEWKEFLSRVVTWPLQHISMYFLTVHEDTPLYFRVKKNMIQLPCDDATVDLYHWSVNFLAEHGFEQYELSSFSRPGCQSRHNSGYWQRKPFKGFGIGAWSFDGKVRFQNEKNIVNYIQHMQEGKELQTTDEVLTRSRVHMERVMLGIRQTKGMPLAVMLSDLSDDEQHHVMEQIAWLKEHKFIRESVEGIITLTPQGLSVEHAISARLAI